MTSTPVPSHAQGIGEGLSRLAATVYADPSSPQDLIGSILQLLAESLDVAQAHVTRVEGGTLQYLRVHDRGGIQVHEGDAIPLTETYCRVMLDSAAPSLVVEDALADERFAGLASTRLAGIGAYTGAPLYHGDGRLFGTLCTLHPQARPVEPDEPALLALAGRIIMQAIDAEAARKEERDRDAERLRASEERLWHQAFHDDLTGLPNRSLLYDRLQLALQGADRTGTPLTLLLMDLDRFKEVNDTFGHHYGDLLLQQVGKRLSATVRASETLARVGGDEFALLLSGVDEQGAVIVAARILDALTESFVVDGNALSVGASIGIALYPDHGQDHDTLLRRADVAMYVAKRSHSGYAIYRSEDDQYNPRRLALIGELREAIEHDHLLLHYQPKVRLTTGRVEGVEALVRWQHPERGMIPPDEFIALAEHTGLIGPLTLWVLNQATQQCRRWHDLGFDLHVAVNLSARNLHESQLTDSIAALLHTWNVQPGWLRLELTESALMTDPFRSIDRLRALRRMGVPISIDDFGIGYSSLSHLRQFPIDEIKIDRSFVRDMTSNENDYRIVRATIRLGHELGLQAVAEGVEDGDVCALLAGLGCDVAQGYHLSRPLPAVQCTEWLRERQSALRPGETENEGRSAS